MLRKVPASGTCWRWEVQLALSKKQGIMCVLNDWYCYLVDIHPSITMSGDDAELFALSAAASTSSISRLSASPGFSSTFSRKSLSTRNRIACERFETVWRTSGRSSSQNQLVESNKLNGWYRITCLRRAGRRANGC